MNERIFLSSLITAIVTPYNTDGSIDFLAFKKLLQRQVDGGTDGVVIGGTTGEGHLMEWKEHLSLIAYAVKNFHSKLAIIGNTGSNNTKEALYATKQGFQMGMDAALLINPYYGKTSFAGLFRHYSLLNEQGPFIIYNVPSRTGQDIEPEWMLQLSKLNNFCGVKECTGLERINEYTKVGIHCWTGNDEETFTVKHTILARGVISVTANIVPQEIRKILDNASADYKKIKPLMDWLFLEPNPIPVNTLLTMMGLRKPVFRLPYVPLSVEKQREILEICQQLELLSDEQPIIIEDKRFHFSP